MVELFLGPTATGRAHQRYRSVHLCNTHTDGVTLRIQGGSVSRCYFNVVRDTRVVSLIRMISRALRRGCGRLVRATLYCERMDFHLGPA